MATFSRNFSKAKMNKDHDERIVPPGEYRDATNIEIATSEGSNVGAAQILMGNTLRNNIDAQVFTGQPAEVDASDNATCVASVESLDRDKIYYFVHDGATTTGSYVKKDYIIEYNPVLEVNKYVFVDIYEVNTTNAFGNETPIDGTNYLYIPIDDPVTTPLPQAPHINNSGVRIGMTMTGGGHTTSDNMEVSDIQITSVTVGNAQTYYWKIYFTKNLTWTSLTAGVALQFKAPRVLEFDPNVYISGINILDDFIFWTDNVNEPKKINIPRSIAGTGGIYYLNNGGVNGYANGSPDSATFNGEYEFFHTRLTKGEASALRITTKDSERKAVYVEKKHVTVIKKSPTQPLELNMYTSSTPRFAEGATTPNSTTGFIPNLNLFEFVTFGLPFQVGDQLVPTFSDVNTTGITLEASSASTTLFLAGANPNIVAGVTVSGTGISGSPYVTAVSGNQITLSSAQTIDVGVTLTFAGSPHQAGTGIEFTEPKDFRVGDILRLIPAESDGNNITSDSYALRVKILADEDGVGPSNNPNELQSLYKGVILSIRGNVTPAQKSFKAVLEDTDSLFEFKFPRFSYRYKYQDGEYSTFAPFSRVAFLADTYNFSPSQGYNLGMSNQLRSLVLKGYHAGEDRMMEDVAEIDILYKETNNPTVYTVTTITPKDTTPGLWPVPGQLDGEHEQRGSIEITTDLIHAVVPSNQLLRAWDNVPRKALAQEISANRLIYGNYLQNFNVPSLPEVIAGYDALSINTESDIISPSVKSMRTYTLGVVYSDEYGRETPVLFNGDSTNGVMIPKDASGKKNLLTCKLHPNTSIPSFATHFSYYIKETSTEYYNLIMDRWYNAEDGNIWISFPSSERNKIKEEDFLILKKSNGSQEPVGGASKYKIISIENEVPDFVKTEHLPIGTIYDEGQTAIAANGDGYPLEDTTYFIIQKSAVHDAMGDDFNENTPGLSVSFSGGDTSTKKYIITKVSDMGNQKYRFHIAGKFESDIGFATNYTDLLSNAIDYLVIRFFKIEKTQKPEYQGRFFVKINRDGDLERHVIGAGDMADPVVVNAWKFTYINNNWCINNGPQGSLMPDDPRSIYNPDIQNEDISSELRSVHPTEHQYHFNQGGTNVTRYYFGGLTGASAETVVTQDAGSQSFLGFEHEWKEEADENPIRMLNDSWSSSRAGGFWITKAGWNTGEWGAGHPFFIDAASAYTFTSFNGFDGYSPAVYSSNGYQTLEDEIIVGTKTGSFGMDNYFETPGVNPVTNQTVVGLDGTSTGATGQQDLFGLDGFIYEGRANYKWADGTDDHPWWKFYDEEYWGPDDESFGSLSGEAYYNSIYQSIDPFPNPNTNTIGNAIGFETHCAPFGNSDAVAANMKQLRGLPGRGIRDCMFTDPSTYQTTQASYMDFSCMLASPSDSLNNIAGMIQDNTSTSGSGVTWGLRWEFAQKMVTPGTRFRFRNDPDEIVYTVQDYTHTPEGYSNDFFWKPGSSRFTGAFGIRNWRPPAHSNVYNWMGNNIGVGGGSPNFDLLGSPYAQFRSWNMRQRWSIVITPRIGSGPAGYNPVQGTKPPDQGGPEYADLDYRRALHHDGTGFDYVEILSTYNEDGTNFTPNAAVFEVLPREAAELDIYYQASPIVPLKLTKKTNEELLPLGTTFEYVAYSGGGTAEIGGTGGGAFIDSIATHSTHTITSWDDERTIRFTPALPTSTLSTNNTFSPAPGVITFTRPDGYKIDSRLAVSIPAQAVGTVTMALAGSDDSEPNNAKIYSQKHRLNWSNCWTFGNGVESDRINDDFNAAQMDNGVKASSTIATQVKAERRKHGVIWSGIYNSISGINDTNQFVIAENITKDLNPIYGSIQKLYNRNTQLIMFCEDKILQAVTNRDLLYKADGSADVVASNTVVGEATPYQGDYGISKNPESFAATPNTLYFSDAMRGKILALHSNGVHDISRKGMKDYFADLCAEHVWRIMGSYDERKNEYNVSVQKKYHPTQTSFTNAATVSFSEAADGWVSFKSFAPEDGVSINNKYYTFNNGDIWQHHSNDVHNNFYGTQYTSDLTLLVNDSPESVKSFGLINYEGSQGKISAFTDADGVSMLNGVYSTNDGITSTDNVYDGEYFNLTASNGWYIDNITTDQQTTGNIEFKEKEGKWFAYPSGEQTLLTNLDEKEFTVQGLGTASMAHSNPSLGEQITITIANNTSTSYSGNGGWGNTGAWDETADE